MRISEVAPWLDKPAMQASEERKATKLGRIDAIREVKAMVEEMKEGYRSVDGTGKVTVAEFDVVCVSPLNARLDSMLEETK